MVSFDFVYTYVYRNWFEVNKYVYSCHALVNVYIDVIALLVYKYVYILGVYGHIQAENEHRKDRCQAIPRQS